MKTRIWPVLLMVAVCFGAPGMALMSTTAAADQVTESTLKGDEPIRLSLDTTKVVKLDRDAASVIVTNPANVRVLLDTPRLLLFMPRTPGATTVVVLDNAGNTILEKAVIVDSGSKSKYVRIRRMCGQTGSGPDCVPTSYFYCPDGCYEVSPVNPAADSAEVPPQAGGGTSTVGAFRGAQPSDLQAPPGSEVPPTPAVQAPLEPQ
ncbi:MAG: pilus assembly protein N-terminal domain-containing protein [bacterium]|nr:pilus assembly protein N-terminal domain-containing protein [bacterium]